MHRRRLHGQVARNFGLTGERVVDNRTMALPDFILQGRKVVGGMAEGEALVTHDTISGWGGINPMSGTIIESRHELRGQSFAGKILVFPGAKGSSGWSAIFHMARLAGKAPAALLFNAMTTKAALGAVVMRIPSMTGFNQDPLQCISTGDWIRINADRGAVEVWKKPPADMDGFARAGAQPPVADK